MSAAEATGRHPIRAWRCEKAASAAWATYRGEVTDRTLIGDMKRLADVLAAEEPA